MDIFLKMSDTVTLIAGDSWACGEWNEHGNTHKGLSQYLNDHGLKTLCFGYPGFGSLTVCDFISSFIEFNRSMIKIKKIIFFQSDWVRDIRAYRWLNDQHLDVLTSGYRMAKNWYISALYYRLSLIYQIYEVPTILIGGQGDTIYIDLFEHEYPGVKIACQSFTNLILENQSRISNPCHSVFKYGGSGSMFLSDKQFDFILTTVKNNSDEEDFKELFEDFDLAQSRDFLFKNNKDIFPDLMHPNKDAHNKLFHYLRDREHLEF